MRFLKSFCLLFRSSPNYYIGQHIAYLFSLIVGELGVMFNLLKFVPEMARKISGYTTV